MSLEDLTPVELLAQHRAALEKNKLFDTLMSDPDTRNEALKLIKRRNPTMPIPELDVNAAAEKALAAERAEREKLEARMRDSEFRERLRGERERLKRENDFSDADLVAIEALMTDEKAPIPHFDAAAKVFKASRVQARPTSSQLAVKTFDMPDKTVWAAGVGNKMALDKAFREQSYAAVNEVRSKAA